MPFEGQTGSEEITVPQEVEMSPNTGEFGGTSSELIHELPRPLSLAEELGVSYAIPLEHYEEIDMACRELFETFILKKLAPLGDNNAACVHCLATNIDELFQIFDKYPNSYRFPLLFRASSFDANLEEFRLKGIPITNFGRYFGLCVSFYLFVNTVKEKFLFSLNPVHRDTGRLIMGHIDFELKMAWGARRVGQVFESLGKGRAETFFERLYKQFPIRRIDIPPGDIPLATHIAKHTFLHGNLGPERIYLKYGSLLRINVFEKHKREVASNHLLENAEEICFSREEQERLDQLDADALSFFLCQGQCLMYRNFIEEFREAGYIPAWIAWIRKHIRLLSDRRSLAHDSFCNAFDIRLGEQGSLFTYSPSNGWAISEQARKKLTEALRTGKGKILSPKHAQLVGILEESANACPDLIPPESHPVCTIPPSVANKTASVLDRGKPAPEKFEPRIPPVTIEKPQIAVPMPTASQIFPGYQENSPKGLHKGELLELDLRGLEKNLPTGTRVSFKRGHASKPKSIESLHCDLGKATQIPPYSGTKDGKLVYAVDFALPEGYTPIGLCLVTASVYYTCPKQLGAQTVEVEAEEKAKENNPVSESMTALELLLGDLIETGKSKRVVCAPETQGNRFRIAVKGNNWEGGPYDDFGEFPLERHASWLVILGDEGEVTIEPKKHVKEIPGNSKIIAYFATIATNEQKKYCARISAEKEEAELQPFREHFAPLLDFLYDLPFNDSTNEENDLGEVQKQILAILPGILLSGHWRMPYTGNTGDSQISWLFGGNTLYPPLRIIYPDRSGESFRVEPNPGSILTSVQVRFFSELAELFSPIAAFLYPTGTTSGTGPKSSPRNSVGKRNMTALRVRRQHLGYMQEFQKRLQTGNATMMILGEKDLWKESAELFPAGDTPSEVPFKVGIVPGPDNITVEEASAEYPNAYCVYRRPSVCFNGHVLNDRVEHHGLGMYASLSRSAHALGILRERILISLNLIDIRKNPDMVDREKIEGNKAWATLFQLAQECGIESGNFAQAALITGDFLQTFIQRLEKEKIGIHYARGVYTKLSQHQHAVRLVSERRKQRESGSTADGSRQIVA